MGSVFKKPATSIASRWKSGLEVLGPSYVFFWSLPPIEAARGQCNHQASRCTHENPYPETKVPEGEDAQPMQETQVELKSENMQQEKQSRESRLSSRFNDAEYERWSQNLRSRTAPKGN